MKEKCTSGCLDGADLFVRDAESTRATDLRTDSAHLLRVDVRRRRLLAMLRKDTIIIRDHRARLVSALGAHRVLGKYLPALESWILGIAPWCCLSLRFVASVGLLVASAESTSLPSAIFCCYSGLAVRIVCVRCCCDLAAYPKPAFAFA